MNAASYAYGGYVPQFPMRRFNPYYNQDNG
jgi:hypothetical protein